MQLWLAGMAAMLTATVPVHAQAVDPLPTVRSVAAVRGPDAVVQPPRLDVSASEAQRLYGEAVAALSAGQRDRAEQLLQLAIRTWPAYVKARYSLGTLKDEDGLTQEALGQFEEALKLDRTHPRLWTNYGIALMRAGRLDESERALEQAAALAPRSPYPANALGFLRERQQRYDDAAQAFQHALELDPTFTAAQVNLGLLALSRRQVQAARQFFTAAGPSSSQALNGLGVLNWFEGRMDDARQAFEQALAIDRNNAPAAFNLALYLTSIGHNEEARYQLSGLEGNRALTAPVLTLLGMIDRQEGHLVQAQDELQRAVAVAPASSQAHQALGVVALESGDLDLAQFHLETAGDLDPANAVVHNDLGLLWQRKGKLGKAIEEVERAAAIAPGIADIQYNLGHLYDLQGRPDLALPHLKRYLELSPQAADAKVVRGRIAELTQPRKTHGPTP